MACKTWPAALALGLLWSSAAWSADALKFGPVPAWVTVLPVPTTTSQPADAPIATLLSDEQVRLEAGKVTTFSALAIRIQTAEGLKAGNISLPWNPATETITVHKLHIIRGSERIDVLAAGQSFTTLRRESNLELATLDGALTANIQPEGLREGDIIAIEMTNERADPVLQGHAEAVAAQWSLFPIQAARAKLSWPGSLAVKVAARGGLAAPRPPTQGGMRTVELRADRVEPVAPPKGAPPRFALGRYVEASTFATWSEVADLLIPLFDKASAIPAGGPLRAEVDRIKAASADPIRRTELALSLVEDRVRYVALLMGEGGYTPADSATTWSRRFGDCKAKTALLLGLLGELGIRADAVLVNSTMGDGIAGHLPMLKLFNHVIVRAEIGGRTYWLDGTRTGDARLATIDPPAFRTGLPLIPRAALVPIMPPPAARPLDEHYIDIDARSGIYAPAPIRIETVFRGDGARMMSALMAQLNASQRDTLYRDFAKTYSDRIRATSGSFSFDRDEALFKLTILGDTKLDWKDRWLFVPRSTLAFKPDFERAPGADQDAPLTVSYPGFTTVRTTLRLPPGFATGQTPPPDVQETLAGIEYRRTTSLKDDVLEVRISERSLAPEVPYRQALAEEPRLRQLYDKDIYVRLPSGYRLTPADSKARGSETLSSADDFVARGNEYMNNRMIDLALADFNEAIKRDPKNALALADRGLAHFYRGDRAAAERDFAAAEAIDPEHAVAARGRGIIALENDDPRAAIAAFTRSLVREPGNNFALGNRARAYAATGDFAAALADSEKVVKADAGWTELRLLRANAFMRQGKSREAVLEAAAMTEAEPGSTYAWVAAARIYERADDRGKAMAAFDRALAIRKEAFIYLNRAQVRPRSAVAERRADLEEAVKLEPTNSDVMAEMIDLLLDTGKTAEAQSFYERMAKAIGPGNDLNPKTHAKLLWRLGRRKEAAALFDRLRAKARIASDYNGLCFTKAELGILLESALAECDTALTMSPGHPAFLDSRGLVKLRLGRFADALADYDQALAKRPFAAAFMGRSLVKARLGDQAGAEADQAAALRLDPRIGETFAAYGLSR